MAGESFTFEEAKAPAKNQDGGFSFEDAAKPSDEPSFFRQIGRQLALTGRHGLTALAALPNLVTGIPNRTINAGINATNRVLGTNYDYLPLPEEMFQKGLTAAGLPEPETPIERFSGAVAPAVGGVTSTMRAGIGLANSTNRTVAETGRILSTAPKMQAASAATGSGAAEIAGEMGAGPWAQTGIGLVAGMAPPVGRAAVAEGGRRLFRGGEQGRKDFENNVGLFERTTGETPTVGQANENLVVQSAESGLSRFPGGNMPLINKGLAEESGLGRKVEDMAASIAPPGTKMSVGKQIEEGIAGPGGYMDEVKATMAKLYGKLDTLMPASSPVEVTNTKAFLDKLAKGQPGAENILKTLQNAKVVDLKGALEADLGGTPAQQTWSLTGGPQTVPGTPGGTSIPFSAWQQVRSRVGELIGDPQLTSEIPKRQLRALYGAMSKDIEAAAKANDAQLAASGAIRPSQTPTLDAVTRANKVTKLIHDRIDEVIQPVMNAGGPEKLYNAALSGTKDGDTTLRNVMRALPQDGRDALTADFFRRLGRAPSSAQNAQGNAFSTERFLTQWNNLSPEAKRTMTIGLPSSFKNDLDDVISVSANLRAGSSVFRNPSGSGQAIVAAGTAGGLATSVFMVPFIGLGPLEAAAGTIASTYAGAKLLTSPTFVHWLAKSTRAPVEAVPAQLNALAGIVTNEKDPEVKQAMSDYGASVKVPEPAAPEVKAPQTAAEYREKFGKAPQTISDHKSFERLKPGEGFIDARDGDYKVKG